MGVVAGGLERGVGSISQGFFVGIFCFAFSLSRSIQAWRRNGNCSRLPVSRCCCSCIYWKGKLELQLQQQEQGERLRLAAH